VLELEQIARNTSEFFFIYKPLILATMNIAVPAAIGYGAFRLFYNPTADRYFEKIAAGLLKITGVDRELRRRYGQKYQNPKL